MSSRILKAFDAPLHALDSLGRQLAFWGRAYGFVPYSVSRYKKEILNHLGGFSFGMGGLALVGGTAVVIVFMVGAASGEIGVQGYTVLNNIGIESLLGFFAAYMNTRVVAPFMSCLALVVTVGAGITAELGSRRISEEIDALEVMAVRPIPFLVTTRIIAALLAATPLYTVGLFISYGSSKLVAVFVYGASAGGYDHYFTTFLDPNDIISSWYQVLGASVVIVSIHCFYGFHASGGPAGVGQAVGRSVRLALVMVFFTLFALQVAFQGDIDTTRIAR